MVSHGKCSGSHQSSTPARPFRAFVSTTLLSTRCDPIQEIQTVNHLLLLDSLWQLVLSAHTCPHFNSFRWLFFLVVNPHLSAIIEVNPRSRRATAHWLLQPDPLIWNDSTGKRYWRTTNMEPTARPCFHPLIMKSPALLMGV